MSIEQRLLTMAATAAFIWTFLPCEAQQPPIPTAITTHFNAMFPEAKNIEWRDKSDNIQVIFMSNGMKCETKFKPDGKWLSTERQIPTDSLPEEVKKGAQSGDYAGWSILKAFVLLYPENIRQYRVVVSNKEMLRKILSFNQQGQIIKNNLSL